MVGNSLWLTILLGFMLVGSTFVLVEVSLQLVERLHDARRAVKRIGPYSDLTVMQHVVILMVGWLGWGMLALLVFTDYFE